MQIDIRQEIIFYPAKLLLGWKRTNCVGYERKNVLWCQPRKALKSNCPPLVGKADEAEEKSCWKSSKKEKFPEFPSRQRLLANTPEVDDITFQTRKPNLLASSALVEEKRKELEENSRGQRVCNLWVRERKRRHTASYA